MMSFLCSDLPAIGAVKITRLRHMQEYLAPTRPPRGTDLLSYSNASTAARRPFDAAWAGI
jgi:hypothetical protein